jgi:hypothetical protein
MYMINVVGRGIWYDMIHVRGKCRRFTYMVNVYDQCSGSMYSIQVCDKCIHMHTHAHTHTSAGQTGKYLAAKVCCQERHGHGPGEPPSRGQDAR